MIIIKNTTRFDRLLVTLNNCLRCQKKRKKRNMEKKILLVNSRRPLLQKLELGSTRNGGRNTLKLIYTPTNCAKKNRNETKKAKAKKWGWQQNIIWGKNKHIRLQLVHSPNIILNKILTLKAKTEGNQSVPMINSRIKYFSKNWNLCSIKTFM